LLIENALEFSPALAMEFIIALRTKGIIAKERPIVTATSPVLPITE
jgi:hypothetical protein